MGHPLLQPLDELHDVAVVDHVALGGLEKALLFPHIVGNVVAAHPEVEVLLWNPEVRQDVVFIVPAQWREYQHEGRDVSGGGQARRPQRMVVSVIGIGGNIFLFLVCLPLLPAPVDETHDGRGNHTHSKAVDEEKRHRHVHLLGELVE